MKSPRDALGEVLVQSGRMNDKIIVLNADLASSTRTKKFKDEFPNRYYNLGICEQNMMSLSGGLASEGFIPVASTFAVFATGRAYDQIRQCIAYSKNNVKIAATHPGLAVGGDGATHQALEDICLMRAIPNMVVLAPSDELETKKAIEKAIEYEGPVYIRIGRAEMPQLYSEDYSFEIGKGNILRSGTDITIISHGIMTYHTLVVAKELMAEGINAEIINMPTIKPIDKELILSSAKKTGALVTVEDHSIYGGLGSSVAEIIVANNPIPMKIIGVQDTFGESGSVKDLYKKYGLDTESIKNQIIGFCESFDL